MRGSLDDFFSYKDYEKHRRKYAGLFGPNGWLLFIACDSGTEFAEMVHREYCSMLEQKKQKNRKKVKVPFFSGITKKFEGDGHDGTCPRIPHHVGGSNVYVFQNVMDKRKSSNPVNDNLVQLCQMISTLKAHGAAKITSIIPYFPYSRQDKPSFMKREYPLARKVADMLVGAKVDRVVSYHPHSTSIIGFFPEDRPFRYISGLDLFVEVFSEFKDDEDAIAFCTDAGGIKENIYLANELGIDYGLAAKHRAKQKKADTIGILGNAKGKKRAIITDDESATFTSCFNVVERLSVEYGIKEFHVGISHMRLDKEYILKLKAAHEKYGMVRVHTTDSVLQIEELVGLPFVKVHPLARRWAFMINRLHYDLSVSKIFYKENDQKE